MSKQPVLIRSAVALIAAVAAIALLGLQVGPRASAETMAVMAINKNLCIPLLAPGLDPNDLVSVAFGCNALDNTSNLRQTAARSAMRNGLDDDGVNGVDDLTELVNQLDARDDGLVNSNFSLHPEDFAGMDLDANQLHDGDGQMATLVFVDDDAPVYFHTDKGKFTASSTASLVCGGLGDVGIDIADDDCNHDGVPGDGVVVAIVGGFGADRGPGVVTIDQEGLRDGFDFTVVGEAHDVAFLTPESIVQGSVEDPTEECPLATSAEGFLDALGLPQKTVIIARALDSDGSAITGAYIEWSTDDPSKAVMAAPLTPTLDLGGFGFGAPNVLCGVAGGRGPVTVTAKITPSLPGGIVPDPLARVDEGSVQITIVGPPASIGLAVSPPAIPCDGVTGSTVAATITDSSGEMAVDGNVVHFDVKVLGTASPINGKTKDGIATSVITPLAISDTGVPVIVTVGDVQSSVMVNCVTAAAPTGGGTTPGGGAGAGTAGAGGTISAPDTGAGGDFGRRAEMPVWPAAALLVAGVVLVGWRFAVKPRASR